MTNSENKGLVLLKKKYPGCMSYKLPDFKQAGLAGMKGLPDYMLFYNGQTLWYEIKMVPGMTIKWSDFTEAQWIVFPRMMAQGIQINLIVFCKKGHRELVLPNTFSSSFCLALE